MRSAAPRRALPPLLSAASPNMPRKTLTVLALLFTCYQVYGDPQNKVNSSKDNVSEESAQRLYSYNPLGTYASANPHGAFSYQIPAIVNSNVAASHLVPVKTESIIVQNSNGFLKDSYGNRFVETPQSVAYKTILPQQYVQLQDLPAHLSQPLLAAAPNYQYRIPSGQYAYRAPYNIFQIQSSPAASALNKFTGQQRPLMYAENIRSSAPTSGVLSQIRGRAIPFQQSLNTESAPVKALRQQSNNNLIYVNPQSYGQNRNINQEPKLQRLEQSNQQNQAYRPNNLAVSENKAPKKLLPITQSITTYINGKKTVINLETRPPLPLLDISLLEPLTFSNPVVPQMQHYLPRIPMATYKKLPDFKVDEAHKHEDELVVTKTKSYDSGITKAEPNQESPESQEQDLETSREQSSSEIEEEEEVEPDQNHENGDISEENSPNYKETYNEQVISYNKETQNDPKGHSYSKQVQNQPVEYSYSKQIQQKPVHYTYIHDSNKPLLVREINYEEEDQPKELMYKFNVNDKRNTHSSAVPFVDQRERPSFQPPQHQNHNHQIQPKTNHQTNNPQPQSNKRHPKSQHQSQHHTHLYQPQHQSLHQPQHQSLHQPQHQSQHQPQHQPQHQSQHQLQHQPQHQSQHQPQPQHQPQHQLQHQPQHQSQYQPQHQPQHQPPHQSQHQLQHQSQYQPQHQSQPQRQTHHHIQHQPLNQPNPEIRQSQKEPQRQPQRNLYQQPRKEHQTYQDGSPADSSHLRPEHRSEQNHNQNINNDLPKVYHHSHPVQVIRNTNTKRVPLHVQTNNPKEFEGNVHLVSQQKPTVQSSYHHNLPKQSANNNYNPLEEVQHKPLNRNTQNSKEHVPYFHGTSKRVIVQNETPDEKHLHDENMMKEEAGHEENSEEEFEKAYKNAAYGFPAFNKDSDEDEKAFDPESYVPKYTAEFNIENDAFQQYQQEDDEYPKNMRASYKDANDKTKEFYYQDYSINKPESLIDRHQKKIDYFKMFRNQKPEYYVGDREEKSQVSKYTVAPSFIFNSQPKKSKQFGQYQSSPDSYEYNYSAEAPGDNTAYGTKAHQKTQSNTLFVEPQYQYGFEPLALPQLLDSELAAMASNDSPDSEKPLRKKLYKENFYIKKTSSSAGKPDS